MTEHETASPLIDAELRVVADALRSVGEPDGGPHRRRQVQLHRAA